MTETDVYNSITLYAELFANIYGMIPIEKFLLSDDDPAIKNMLSTAAANVDCPSNSDEGNKDDAYGIELMQRVVAATASGPFKALGSRVVATKCVHGRSPQTVCGDQ